MDHPIIEFKPVIAPLLPPKKTEGLLIGEYLVVSYATIDLTKPTYAIYNTLGRRLFKTSYQKVEEAVKKAEWLDNIFHEFFIIWEEWPDADIFLLAQLSVENGAEIYETLREE